MVITDGDPVGIAGSIYTPIDYKSRDALNITPFSGTYPGRKVIKVSVTRTTHGHSMHICEGKAYVHKTEDLWGVYSASDLKTLNVPYTASPLKTIPAVHPEWQRMIAEYRNQEGLDMEESE